MLNFVPSPLALGVDSPAASPSPRNSSSSSATSAAAAVNATPLHTMASLLRLCRRVKLAVPHHMRRIVMLLFSATAQQLLLLPRRHGDELSTASLALMVLSAGTEEEEEAVNTAGHIALHIKACWKYMLSPESSSTAANHAPGVLAPQLQLQQEFELLWCQYHMDSSILSSFLREMFQRSHTLVASAVRSSEAARHAPVDRAASVTVSAGRMQATATPNRNSSNGTVQRNYANGDVEKQQHKKRPRLLQQEEKKEDAGRALSPAAMTPQPTPAAAAVAAAVASEYHSEVSSKKKKIRTGHVEVGAVESHVAVGGGGQALQQQRQQNPVIAAIGHSTSSGSLLPAMMEVRAASSPAAAIVIRTGGATCTGSPAAARGLQENISSPAAMPVPAAESKAAAGNSFPGAERNMNPCGAFSPLERNRSDGVEGASSLAVDATVAAAAATHSSPQTTNSSPAGGGRARLQSASAKGTPLVISVSKKFGATNF